jgi:hypothetical protein
MHAIVDILFIFYQYFIISSAAAAPPAVPSYRDAVRTAIAVPVLGAVDRIEWFHRGVGAASPRHGRGQVW